MVELFLVAVVGVIAWGIWQAFRNPHKGGQGDGDSGSSIAGGSVDMTTSSDSSSSGGDGGGGGGDG